MSAGLTDWVAEARRLRGRGRLGAAAMAAKEAVDQSLERSACPFGADEPDLRKVFLDAFDRFVQAAADRAKRRRRSPRTHADYSHPKD